MAYKYEALRKAVLFIEENYMNHISLSDIIGAAGADHSTLTELLKSSTGMTAMQYLMNHRVIVAKKYLVYTDMPIKTVAMRCGFKTVQHFSRVFKAHVGDTPALFRKSTVQKRHEELSKRIDDR